MTGVEISKQNDYVLLTMTGNFDLSAAREMEETFTAACALCVRENLNGVVVGLDRLSYIGSAAFSQIIVLWQNLRKYGKRLVFLNPTSEFSQVYDLLMNTAEIDIPTATSEREAELRLIHG